MPAASVQGDNCVGAITPTGYADWNGRVVVRGDTVAPHPPFPTLQPHCCAVTSASGHVLLNGIPVTVAGDPANACGHAATGSSHVILS